MPSISVAGGGDGIDDATAEAAAGELMEIMSDMVVSFGVNNGFVGIEQRGMAESSARRVGPATPRVLGSQGAGCR